MRRSIRSFATVATASACVLLAACGGHDKTAAVSNGNVAVPPAQTGSVTPVAPAPAAHHSKIGGALVGAAAGHVLGGHAVLGAAAGALVQHERNKHH